MFWTSGKQYERRSLRDKRGNRDTWRGVGERGKEAVALVEDGGGRGVSQRNRLTDSNGSRDCRSARTLSLTAFTGRVRDRLEHQTRVHEAGSGAAVRLEGWRRGLRALMTKRRRGSGPVTPTAGSWIQYINVREDGGRWSGWWVEMGAACGWREVEGGRACLRSSRNAAVVPWATGENGEWADGVVLRREAEGSSVEGAVG
jgi:hypothetical protein